MVNIQNLNKLIEFTKTLTILYVEDNQDSRESTLKMLNHFFDNIIIAEDGLIGLDKFKTNQESIDIVLTDINMPNMNGIEMLESIRDLDKLIPCIILSAHDEIDFFLRSIKLGIDGYILKPVEIKQFVDVLSKIIYYITLEKEKAKAKKSLEEFAYELHKQVELEVSKNKEQEKQLVHQSKLAAMGEMIDAIAHQWMQPISNIKALSDSLKMKITILNQDISNKDILNCTEEVSLQINHIINTLHEFRSFFRPNSIIKKYNIEDIIQSSLLLLKDNIQKHKLLVDVKCNNIYANINDNEFKHVIINLINNAKDAFEENKIQNKKISILVVQNISETIITVEDNAGGIPKNIIDNIFKANITSKADGKGTGIGLYMSQQIIEKLNGTIDVVNTDSGAIFTIIIPSS
jgi:signal transduction histidine kinase